MDDDAYLTISETAEGFFKDRGSKFLGFAYPVKNEASVKNYLNSLKKNYYDARHYCYAFMIGKTGTFYRAGDDGEPANSAGAPILGQIRSRKLSDVLVVVVRYFGGTKLGVPGLIHAYKTAAAMALDNAEIVTVYLKKQLRFHFKYEEMNEVMRWVKEFDMEIITQSYTENCVLQVNLRQSYYQALIHKVKSFPAIKIELIVK